MSAPLARSHDTQTGWRGFADPRALTFTGIALGLSTVGCNISDIELQIHTAAGVFLALVGLAIGTAALVPKPGKPRWVLSFALALVASLSALLGRELVHHHVVPPLLLPLDRLTTPLVITIVPSVILVAAILRHRILVTAPRTLRLAGLIAPLVYCAWMLWFLTTRPPFAEAKIVELAVAEDFGCARSEQGQVVCWSAGMAAQAWPAEAVELAAGDGCICVRLKNGAIRCFTPATSKQDEDGALRLWHLDLVPGDATLVAAGSRHICLARRSGGALCAVMQGSRIPNPSHSMPAHVFFEGADLIALGVGHGFACAIARDGTPACVSLAEDSPAPPQLPGGRARALAVGEDFACALYDGQGVACEGTGGLHGRLWPAARSIAAGRDHVCALLDSGAVECAGANHWGQLGSGSRESVGSADPLLARVPEPARTLWAWGSRSCAQGESGAIVCWGKTTHGELRTREWSSCPADAGASLSTIVRRWEHGGDICTLAPGRFRWP